MSIKAVDLNFVYGGGTAFEQHALFDVNLETNIKPISERNLKLLKVLI